ncbi:MAG: FMN-binding protein [Candidatus Polarisedimenticolia bacterium]
MRGLLSLILVAWAAALPCSAKVYMTQEEALKAALPSAPEPQRLTAFLTDAQVAEAEKASGQPVSSRVITWYRSSTGVTAWFDTHIVRTHPETIMVVVSPASEILRIDILSFAEPDEYLPRPRWTEQLHGKRLDDDLSLRGAVRPMTGATLTARAIVAASRRVLALHGILEAGAP